VILPQDLVTDKAEHPGEGIPDHRAAQVPDVHLLGHVGCRVVDDDPLRIGGDRHPDALVRSGRRDQVRHELVGQGQIDEPLPADLDRCADVVE
jgi:hypothetical protein